MNLSLPKKVGDVIQVPVHHTIAATCPLELSLAIMSGGGRPTNTNKDTHYGASHEILHGGRGVSFTHTRPIEPNDVRSDGLLYRESPNQRKDNTDIRFIISSEDLKGK